MGASQFVILSLNCRRFERYDKLINIKNYCDLYSPDLICFQEVFVPNYLTIFSEDYEVFANVETNQKIGTALAIRKGIRIMDFAMCNLGRIIGIKLSNIQVWNVYAASGSGNKKVRESFFRETLPNLMSIWKDDTKHIVQAGDHNCTQRYADSENVAWQKHHVQQGLLGHMECYGLKDELLNFKGQGIQGIYSRITSVSKTRIDFIMSNTDLCTDFQYLDTEFLGLDHKAALAKYSINLGECHKERVPNDSYFSGWVISKQLENDDMFIEMVREAFDELVDEERMCEDWTYTWMVGKFQIIEIAKERERQIKKRRLERKQTLQIFLRTVLKSIAMGNDRWNEYNRIKADLVKISDKKSEEAVDHLKFDHIKDHMYDIQKLKAQKRYENKGKINSIIIEGTKYEGTENVVTAIKEKLRRDLSKYGNQDWDDPPTASEAFFLNKVAKADLDEDEKKELLGPITEEEVRQILTHEVDLDSSPGEDGITYRLLRKLIEIPSFLKCLVKMLDYIRKNKNMGYLENLGIMKLLNKKLPSENYIKKRKLTMVNKSENSLSGMIWTKRLKKIILPQVLPSFQYICQANLNVIDENREIRNIVNHLKSEQHDGTILAIDFKDAFRSTSLRWCNLVMKSMNIPPEFIAWFWGMYENLCVSVVINKWKSDKIPVKRGFMEGHAPSMAAFVIAAAPLGLALEQELEGIYTPDGILHKIKTFADDSKLVLKNVDTELKRVYETISKFELVSGNEMHRDPSRGKCQALSFGSHKRYEEWPMWVTVKNEINILGIWYSNKESLEKCNSRAVFDVVDNHIMGKFSMRGTPLQKAAYANTYIFSKIWYVAQTIKMDENTMKKITQKILNFIWAGQNERPVRALNFRGKDQGGLGLMCPSTKSKALLIKNMFKDYLILGNSPDNINGLYGCLNDFKKVLDSGVDLKNVKQIYDGLMNDVCFRNGSLIPSRAEKRSTGVKWKVAWKNLQQVKGVTAQEKYFQWQVQQDMLPVGDRLHRQGSEKRCLSVMENNRVCTQINDRQHLLLSCPCPPVGENLVKQILTDFLDRTILDYEILHFSFNHRCKKRLSVAVWAAVKLLFWIYCKKCFNKIQLLDEMLKEIEWNLKMTNGLGSLSQVVALKMCILRHR